MARTITPHKGGRTERFEARMTSTDKELLESLMESHGASKADIFAAAINVLESEFTIIERHALIHGIEKIGYDAERELTVVRFGDGAIIRQQGDKRVSSKDEWSSLDIQDFFIGFWFDSRLSEMPFDNTILDVSNADNA